MGANTFAITSLDYSSSIAAQYYWLFCADSYKNPYFKTFQFRVAKLQNTEIYEGVNIYASLCM